MRHHQFTVASQYPVALLMKSSAFTKGDLVKNYLTPLTQRGVSQNALIAFTLEYNAKTLSAQFGKDYLAQLLPELHGLGVKYLLCTDGSYFKLLTGMKKADPNMGYVLPCAIKGFEHLQVILSLNYQQLIYNPDLQAKLDQSLDALASHLQGGYQAPGSTIIHKAVYPKGVQEIADALEQLKAYPELTADIEAFSLSFWEAGIGTMSFAIDQHRGIAFACDYQENADTVSIPLAEKRQEYGRKVVNPAVRALIKDFLTSYTGKITWHHAGYDVKVILYTLWMRDFFDQAGLLEGLEILTRNIDDTKLIAYLATNSTAGNNLRLKHLAQEFAGNWAVDEINDIKLIPLPELLQYNLVDALSTWFVKGKYTPIMIADQQQDIYQNLYLPSQKLILQMELTGMPMNRAKIDEIEAKLSAIDATEQAKVRLHPLIAVFEDAMTEAKWEKDYQDRRNKAKNPDKILYKDFATFPRHEFNPGSPNQLQDLLYHADFLGLPIIDRTETKLPATGEDTLAKLKHHAKSPADVALIEALIAVSQVSTILSTFIPAFKRAIAKAPDGIVWLHGSFNLGGTVSGRLSSSDPNLQNIPAKSIFAKLIKEAFMAPKGWLFCGADFNSLEDMISALTTKDPNKLKVYTDGFDGHALRAVAYFPEELKALGFNIDPNDPKQVNVLKKLDHPLRQKSKTPTFALTYQGTYHTLMTNLGWPEAVAKQTEANYHKLYVVSDQYVADKLKQANKDGYVTVAFGLRVRTPLIKQVVWNGPKMPFAAAAEGRTAGNALGQSYCQLNNRAAVAFFKVVWASKYKHDILPSAMIHDAIYVLVREDPEVVEFANRELIKAMQWQDLPEIQHPTVKLGAALDIFWPHWGNGVTLPNDADQATIIQVCRDARTDYLTPEKEAA